MAMPPLDLRHILLEDHGILATATKAAMYQHARARGYSLENIRPALNRFNRFWVIGQWVEYGHTIRLATLTGDTVIQITARTTRPW